VAEGARGWAVADRLLVRCLACVMSKVLSLSKRVQRVKFARWRALSPELAGMLVGTEGNGSAALAIGRKVPRDYRVFSKSEPGKAAVGETVDLIQ
jgi:hypothetical protein